MSNTILSFSTQIIVIVSIVAAFTGLFIYIAKTEKRLRTK